MYDENEGWKYKFWYRVYSVSTKLGIIRLDTWLEDEDDGMKHVVVEPRWFFQRKRG